MLSISATQQQGKCQVATVMGATGHISAALQINPSCSSGGDNVHPDGSWGRGSLEGLAPPPPNFGKLILIVRAVRGILMRECANLYKSMKIGTLVIFDMLCPNLPRAKANSQWCRHIRQFKMAAA